VAVLLAAALTLLGVVARAVGGGEPRRRPADDRRHVADRRRLDKGTHVRVTSEALNRIPADSARIVLQTIALQAQSLTGSELAAAGVGGDDTRPFSVWAHVGMPPDQVEQIGRPPRVVGLFASVARQNRTLRVRDVRQYVEHEGLPPHHPPISSFLAVPIRFHGEVAGCLCVGNKQGGGEFTVEDQQLAEMLAARAAGALDAEWTGGGPSGAQRWLQTVFDQMPEGVLVVDRRGQVVTDNEALRSFLRAQTSADGRLDLGSIEMSHSTGERLPSQDLPVMRAVADSEVTIGREFVARGRDDQPVPLLVSAAPILSSGGIREGAVMICQDISTVRSVQRAREEWTSIVAHELRQPISVIALRSSLLLRSQLTSEQHDCVEQIARSIRSLGRMVTDLMDASLLESDRLRVSFARVDLGQLLAEIVRRTPLAGPRTRLQLPPGLRLFVKGDAQRLEQVIANLLSNAIKYAPPATDVVIDLRLEAGQAHVRTSNAGEAIPQDELPFIFNRFTRTQAAGTSGVTGLGLGLYIARGLVSAHHGRIWAESSPGTGTTFHVTFPLDGLPAAAEGSAVESILPPPEGGRHDTAAAAGRSRTTIGLSAGAGARRARTPHAAERLPLGRL
jgi:signal transduction histidine kinase